MDIGAIKARIAELEQRKAERKAMRGYRDVSYLDYITQGDRSGFDRISADEIAYRNMLKQQEFNARENELNRQNAQEIARVNKEEQNEYKLDEYRRGRNKAASIMSSYQEALTKDPNNTQLKKEFNLAKEDYDYYDRKLGGQGYTEPTPTPLDTPKESTNIYKGLSNDERLSIANSIHSRKVYSEEDKSKLQALADATDDPKTKEQILTIKSNKGKTDNVKEQEELAKLEKYAANNLLDSKQRKRLEQLRKKYPKGK